MSDKPLWRSAIEQVDAWVEPQLSKAVHHESFARATGLAYQLKHGLGAEAGKLCATVLHAVNLPTRSDVNRVLRQVAVLEREVRGLSDQMEAATREDDRHETVLP